MRFVKLNDEVCDLLKECGEDVDQLVNSICFLYAKKGFIRKSEVEGFFVINKAFRKNSAEAYEVFDEVTHEFKGVVLTGKKESESIFIPDERLHDLVKENSVIMIMKAPREKGISSKEVDETYIKLRKDELM